MVHIWPIRSPVNINMTCSLSENPGSYYHSFQYFSASISSICGIMVIKQKMCLLFLFIKKKWKLHNPEYSCRLIPNKHVKQERKRPSCKRMDFKFDWAFVAYEEAISNALWVLWHYQKNSWKQSQTCFHIFHAYLCNSQNSFVMHKCLMKCACLQWFYKGCIQIAWWWSVILLLNF